MIDRRRFLGLRTSGAASLELSCETLYMRLVDARAAGTAGALLARMQHELRVVRELRLRDSEWLAREDLEKWLAPLLETFRARAGRVTLLPNR